MNIWNKIGIEKNNKWFNDFKWKFNTLTGRRIKAEMWMENPNTKMEDIEKHIGEYYKIVIEISNMMHEYEKVTGQKLNDKELFEGFN